MQSSYKTNMQKIKDMIECPRLYLDNYFSAAKTEVDVYFETKLSQIQDNRDLNDKINKKRSKLIEIIEKCQFKCVKKKLSDDVINDVKDSLECVSLEARLVHIKYDLENQLLENDSYGVILTELDDTQRFYHIFSLY